MTVTEAFRAANHHTCCVRGKPICSGCEASISKGREKSKRSFSLKGAPAPHVLLDMDAAGLPRASSGKRCDYLFAADGQAGAGMGGYVAPIEMSSGRKDAQELTSQLQGGADVAARILPENIRINCIPVYIGGLNAIEKRRLAKPQFQVRFRGATGQEIRTLRSPARLAAVLR